MRTQREEARRRATAKRAPIDAHAGVARRAEPEAGRSTIADWSASLAAGEGQLTAFDDALARLRAPGGDVAPVQLDVGSAATPAAEVTRIAAHGTRGAGSSLPHAERIQRAFGRHDVSHVRAFVGGAAGGTADAIGANAYASGDAVVFRGAPSLRTAAHEAAHVVQQRAGIALPGGVGRAGDAFERHADRVADAVAAGRSAEPLLDGLGTGARSGPGLVQRETSIGSGKGWLGYGQKYDPKNGTVKPLSIKLDLPIKFFPIAPFLGVKIAPKVEGELVVDTAKNTMSGSVALGLEGTLRLAPAALMEEGGVDFKLLAVSVMSVVSDLKNLTMTGPVTLSGEISMGYNFFKAVQFEHKFAEANLLEVGRLTVNLAYGLPPKPSWRWEGVTPCFDLRNAREYIKQNPAKRRAGEGGGHVIGRRSSPDGGGGRGHDGGGSGYHFPTAAERNARAWANLLRALGIQRKAVDADAADAPPTPTAAGVAAEGLAGGGRLPHLAAIQQAFGAHDVTGVSANVGGRAAEASAALGARAYASGDRIAFGQSPDLHTAAHEAAHVIQQRAGANLPSGIGAEGDGYERHADAVADAVVGGRSAEPLLDGVARGGGGRAHGGAVVQRAPAARSKIDVQADAIAKIAKDACPAPQVAKYHGTLRSLVAAYLRKYPHLGGPLTTFFRTYVQTLAPKGMSASQQYRVLNRLIEATRDLSTTFATQSQGYNCATEVEQTLIKIYKPELLLQYMTNELKNATAQERQDLVPTLGDETLGKLAGSQDASKGLNAAQFRRLTMNVMGWSPVKTQTIPETDSKLDMATNAFFKWSLRGMRDTIVAEVRTGRIMTISLQAEPGSTNLHKLLVTKLAGAVEIYDPGYGQRFLLEAITRPPLSSYGKVITWEVYQVPKHDPARAK